MMKQIMPGASHRRLDFHRLEALPLHHAPADRRHRDDGDDQPDGTIGPPHDESLPQRVTTGWDYGHKSWRYQLFSEKRSGAGVCGWFLGGFLTRFFQPRSLG